MARKCFGQEAMVGCWPVWLMGYGAPEHGKDGTLGIGAVIGEPVVKMQIKDQHLLTLIHTISKKSFVYYTLAAWAKAGMITVIYMILKSDWKIRSVGVVAKKSLLFHTQMFLKEIN
jgi:hypothetical protein